MASGLVILRQHRGVVVALQLTRQVEVQQAQHQRVVKCMVARRRQQIRTIVREVAAQARTIEARRMVALAHRQVHSTAVVLQTTAVLIQEVTMVVALIHAHLRQVVALIAEARQEVAVRRIVAHLPLRVVAILRHRTTAEVAVVLQVRVRTRVEVAVAAHRAVVHRVVEAHQEAQDKLKIAFFFKKNRVK